MLNTCSIYSQRRASGCTVTCAAEFLLNLMQPGDVWIHYPQGENYFWKHSFIFFFLFHVMTAVIIFHQRMSLVGVSPIFHSGRLFFFLFFFCSPSRQKVNDLTWKPSLARSWFKQPWITQVEGKHFFKKGTDAILNHQKHEISLRHTHTSLG